MIQVIWNDYRGLANAEEFSSVIDAEEFIKESMVECGESFCDINVMDSQGNQYDMIIKIERRN